MKFNISILADEMLWLYDIYKKRPDENEITYFDDSIYLIYRTHVEQKDDKGEREYIVKLDIEINDDLPLAILADMIYDKIVLYGKNSLLSNKDTLVFERDDLLEYLENNKY
ncbi:MAG TPA: hypothetical protein EYH42_06200 [Sulfurovum sp.]|nr:hypothetical protein [Pyrodictium sp.]HIQ28074.1 hypothetical protein [Sulfurovum sp.]